MLWASIKKKKMNSEVINTKFGEIEYSSVGQGIPIIFVHGGHSNCNETLCHKGFDLNKYRLIIPSRPGYGKTPLNKNKSPRQTAELIIELVKHLTLDRIIVYGISAGGLTAIELASNYPDFVCKLILASAISKKWLDEQGTTYKTAKRIFNPKVEKITWGAVNFFSDIFPDLIAKSFFPQFSKKTIYKLKKSDILELVSTMKHYNSKTGFLNDIDQNIDNEVITKIKCPTLIIHSEFDNSVPIEHAKYANKMIEYSEIQILQNEWGHLIWLGTDSKIAIEKIMKFIEN